MKNKNVYIIAGPNGSGKTTFARTFLPEYAKCKRFINADLIASGLSPFSPQRAAIKSAKLVLEQIRECSNAGVDFGFETTMSGVTYLNYFREFKRKGYQIHIFFLWIPSSELAIARVKNRVAQGGHNVPVGDIKRRFKKSAENFLNNYRLLADRWMLFDNSQCKPRIIAVKQSNSIEVFVKELFEDIIEKAGADV